MLHFAVYLLESIFFIGLAGSLVVAVLAFVGDIHVFLDKDKPEGQNALKANQRNSNRMPHESSSNPLSKPT